MILTKVNALDYMREKINPNNIERKSIKKLLVKFFIPVLIEVKAAKVTFDMDQTIGYTSFFCQKNPSKYLLLILVTAKVTGLNVPKIGISPVFSNEFIMMPFFCNLSITQNEDSVRISNRGKPVCDHKCCFSFGYTS